MTAPTLVAKTLNSISVQWLPPTSDGDAVIDRYILYIKAEFETTYHEIYSGRSTTYTATLLSTGFNYQFKVRSVNAAGPSDLSPASSSIITALGPSVPLNLDLVSRSDTSITFKWDPPLSDGGLNLLGYKVYMAIGSGSYSEVITAPSSTDPTILTHTQTASITGGQAYRFKVSAYNLSLIHI